jgi:hypothetical protein
MFLVERLHLGLLHLFSKGSWYVNFKFDRDDSGNVVRPNEQLRHIPKFMSTMWKLKKPKIIIPIITGVTNFKNWKNRKLEDQFKRGILKVCFFRSFNRFHFNTVKHDRQQTRQRFGLPQVALMEAYRRW